MNTPSPVAIARVLWPYALLWVVLAAALTTTVFVQVANDRERDIANARTRLDSVSRLLADNVTRALDGIDRTLAAVKTVHEREPSAAPLDTLFDAFRTGDEIERGIALFDRNGRLLTATGPASARSIWDAGAVVDFADASMHPGAQLRVQRPVTLRANAHAVVPVAKRLEARGGEFDGVVASAIDASRLLAAYGPPRANDSGVVGLAFENGRVIARSGAPAATSADGAQATLMLSTARGTSEAGVEWRVLDDRRHLVAARDVGATGLVAFAVIEESAVLASNRLFIANALGLLIVTIAAITVPLAFVARRAVHDVCRRHRLETDRANERSRARCDPLTGIANRASFDEHLKNCHLLLARYGKPFVLAFLDVDRFRQVNDADGRGAGDRALRELARTMQNVVRQTDLVARLDGDAFAILMPGARVSSVRRVLDQLRSTLGVDAAIGGWPITFSVGVVAFESAPPRPIDAANLADSLMHEVKGSGRDGIRYAVYRDHELLNAAHAAAA
jgi:diguanylate cyclase (GGDEF)-like protein